MVHAALFAATAISAQDCPNGRCPLVPSQGIAFTAAAAPPVSSLGETPVGTPPGPGYSWRSLPGIGYGWVHDSVGGPEVVGGPIAKLGRKIVCQRLRNLAIERAVDKGMPRAEAIRKVNKITDEQILGGGIAMGAPAPVGKLGDGKLLQWLWDHKEEILKFILAIVALFGDDEPM